MQGRKLICNFAEQTDKHRKRANRRNFGRYNKIINKTKQNNMDNRLQNFLIDDVRKLIAAIDGSPELAAMNINPNGDNFDTLEDFAIYWKHHIKDINKTK